jgi:hypothetical protein
MWPHSMMTFMNKTVPYTGGADVQGTIVFALIVIFTIMAMWIYNSR